MHDKIGRVVLAVFDGCRQSAVLNDASLMELAIVDACKKAGATVLGSNSFQFFHEEESGVRDGATSVTGMAESHAAGHSWPRRKVGQFAVMVHTCGDIDPKVIVDSIGHAVGATRHKIVVMDFDELIADLGAPWISGDG